MKMTMVKLLALDKIIRYVEDELGFDFMSGGELKTFREFEDCINTKFSFKVGLKEVELIIQINKTEGILIENHEGDFVYLTREKFMEMALTNAEESWK